MSAIIRAIGSKMKSAVTQKMDEYQKYGISADKDFKYAIRQEATDEVVATMDDPFLDGNYKVNYMFSKLMQVAGPYYRAGSDAKFAQLVKYLTMAEIEWKRTYNTNMEMAEHQMVRCMVLKKRLKMVMENGRQVEKQEDVFEPDLVSPLTFCELLKLGKCKIVSIGDGSPLEDDKLKIERVAPRVYEGEKPAHTSAEIIDRINKIAEEDFIPFLRAAWQYQHLDKDISPYGVNVLHLGMQQTQPGKTIVPTSTLRRQQPSDGAGMQ